MVAQSAFCITVGTDIENYLKITKDVMGNFVQYINIC